MSLTTVTSWARDDTDAAITKTSKQTILFILCIGNLQDVSLLIFERANSIYNGYFYYFPERSILPKSHVKCPPEVYEIFPQSNCRSRIAADCHSDFPSR